MNVVSYDPNFHDSRVVTASDLREKATEELGYPWMEEWQSSQRRPSQQTVDLDRPGSNSASTSQIGLTNWAHCVRFFTRPERARSASKCALTGRTHAEPGLSARVFANYTLTLSTRGAYWGEGRIRLTWRYRPCRTSVRSRDSLRSPSSP